MIVSKDDGTQKANNQFIGVHKCTEKDYNSFYPVARSSLSSLTEMKKREVLYCLDDLDQEGKPMNDKMFGKNDISENAMISLIAVPCISDLMVSKGYKIKKSNCPTTKDPVTLKKILATNNKYMGEPDIIVFYNEQSVDLSNFDKKQTLVK